MILIPKNWRSFQHYNKRNPPWIKLHRALLDNYEFAMLPVESKALAPMLWLIASENKEGFIQMSSDALAYRLRMSIESIETGLKPLILGGFFMDASTMLAGCSRDATPETEAETETEPFPGREPQSMDSNGRDPDVTLSNVLPDDWTADLEGR